MISVLLSLALAQAPLQATPPTPTVTAPHYVVLAWTLAAPTLPQTAGATYTVRRSVGLCADNPPFATIAAGLTTMTYSDTTVSPGNWCYKVATVYQGAWVELPNPPMAQAVVPQ